MYRMDPHSQISSTTSRFTGAAVGAILWTAIPKLPARAELQPDGAGSGGGMAAVTACGRATGFALTTMARAMIASEYCIASRLIAIILQRSKKKIDDCKKYD